MGITVDGSRGRVEPYVTCDNCGYPIFGAVQVDPPGEFRDDDRHVHADGCPDVDPIDPAQPVDDLPF